MTITEQLTLITSDTSPEDAPDTNSAIVNLINTITSCADDFALEEVFRIKSDILEFLIISLQTANRIKKVSILNLLTSLIDWKDAEKRRFQRSQLLNQTASSPELPAIISLIHNENKSVSKISIHFFRMLLNGTQSGDSDKCQIIFNAMYADERVWTTILEQLTGTDASNIEHTARLLGNLAAGTDAASEERRRIISSMPEVMNN